MKPISHRGNKVGPLPHKENTVDYVECALASGYDVEIDVHCKDNRLWLGHDGPEEEISVNWLAQFDEQLWIHCKDLESLQFLRRTGTFLNFFGHSNDPFVLTSRGYLFCLPSHDLDENCVLVMPEHFNFTPRPDNKAYAVLTDYPESYK